MSTPTNHWKLGLFVVVGVVLTMCTIVFLGAQSLQKHGVVYKTFFDESVQGLEIGSPVKFRGVTVGNVSDIAIAPDRRHVEVESELTIKDLNELGLNDAKKKGKAHVIVPNDLRVQLVSQGITGVKFLQLDFFDLKDNPPPVLPFPVPENYIPAAVSTMKNLEDAVVRAVNRFPELADGILKVTVQIGRMLDDVESKKLPDAAVAMLAHTNQVLTTLQGALSGMNTGKLSTQAQEVLANLNGTIARANALLARVDGDKGLMVSVQRASDAVGDVATNSRGLSRELEETLRDIQEVTAAVQRVAEALERDPDMLVKGRGASK